MSNHKVFDKKILVVALSSALSLGVAGEALSVSETDLVELNIKGQKAGSALISLGEAAGVQMVFSGDIAKNAMVSEISGEYSLGAALKKMLKGSGLSYEFVSENTVLIKAIEDQGDNDSGEEQLVEEVVVTGTRLRNVSPTGQVEVITREDMIKLGVSSAEDVVRSLPQNFSTLNQGSTATNGGLNGVPSSSLGQSAANLRGMGTGATLILLNGRRVAGSPTFDADGTVNLASIPFAAIERVEVLLDGASAIYGSDAIAGVINFITRKDYQGAETTIRYENSAHDGDVEYLSQIIGSTWGTGNATATLTYRNTDSVNTRKAGYTTEDYTRWGGPDFTNDPEDSPGIDGRGNMTPAAEFFWPGFGYYTAPIGPTLGSLPEGFSGSSWTAADLGLGNVPRHDNGARAGGGTSESTEKSFTLNINQELTDSISAYADILYSVTENESTNSDNSYSLSVPSTNPFNQLTPFSGGIALVNVRFSDDSPLSRNYQNSEFTRINFNAGASIDITNDWQLKIDGSYGEEENKNSFSGLAFGSPAFETALAGGYFDEDGVTWIPSPALNPFTGEHDPDLDVNTLLGPRYFNGQSSAGTSLSDNMSFEVSANGSLFSISGGDVSAVVTASYRQESIDYSKSPIKLSLLSIDDRDHILDRDNIAASFEVAVPLVGADNAFSGMQEFLVTLAGRWEEYSLSEVIDPDPNAAATEAKFNNFSPKVGVKWQLADDFSIRAGWTEAFRAPTISELTEPMGEEAPWAGGFFPFFDYDHPSGTPQDVYGLTFRSGGNSNLQAETSTTVNIGFDWIPSRLDGLTVSLNYTDTEWENKVDFVDVSDPRVAQNSTLFPELFLRDPAGNLQTLVFMPINIASKAMEVVDMDIEYIFDTEWGSFEVGGAASYTLGHEDALLPGDTPIEHVGTDIGPDDLVAKLRLGWSRANYGANMFVNYSSSYTHTRNGQNATSTDPRIVDFNVDSYTTVDVTGYYNTDSGWSYKAGVRNLFNADFPIVFVGNRTSYDPARVDPRGRVVYLEVAKRFDF